jgi:ankyrin repeat protein
LYAGADINLSSKDTGFTALMYACINSKYNPGEKIVEILLNHSALNVNVQDINGQTALLLAIDKLHSNSTEKTVQLLLEHPSIDVNLGSKCNLTPLMVACSRFITNNATAENVLKHLVAHPNIDFSSKHPGGLAALAWCPSNSVLAAAQIMLCKKKD